MESGAERTANIFENDGKLTGIFAYPLSQGVNRLPKTSA
jgi:hypothetical protein